jgi:hypothetical protein
VDDRDDRQLHSAVRELVTAPSALPLGHPNRATPTPLRGKTRSPTPGVRRQGKPGHGARDMGHSGARSVRPPRGITAPERAICAASRLQGRPRSQIG